MLTPWKESYDQPRQHIKKQRHYFAKKGPSSQGYGEGNGTPLQYSCLENPMGGAWSMRSQIVGWLSNFTSSTSISLWFYSLYVDFILGGSKITADGDCSHEMKRCLLLGRKVMASLDSILKSRDITLLTKVRIVKAMVFPVVVYGCESWTIK